MRPLSNQNSDNSNSNSVFSTDDDGMTSVKCAKNYSDIPLPEKKLPQMESMHNSNMHPTESNRNESRMKIREELLNEWENIKKIRDPHNQVPSKDKHHESRSEPHLENRSGTVQHDEVEIDNPENQYIVGMRYKLGIGVEKNEAAGIEWFIKAANQGGVEAQAILGMMYIIGKGVEKDDIKGTAWCRKAAEQGHVECQFIMGLLCTTGEAFEKDQAQAEAWLLKAAHKGHAKAQAELGKLYDQGNEEIKNLVKAVDWYRKAADQGEADAQYNLAECYAQGKGIKKDETKAAIWFIKSAAQGHTDAQYRLGECYEYGRGVENDDTEAVACYLRAADQGHVDAQAKSGKHYLKGEGVKKNNAKAFYYLHQAAKQGHAEAQQLVGVMYSSGKGIKQDHQQAFNWSLKAAENNNQKAQINAVKLFMHGIGVDQDLAKAAYWLLRSALSENLGEIQIDGNKYFDLIPFLPFVITSYPEFKQITTIAFDKLPNAANGQMGATFSQLIQSHPELISLKAENYEINDAEAQLIMESLVNNTTLNEFIINYAGIDRTKGKFDKIKMAASKRFPKIFGPDTSKKAQLKKVANQNKAVLELRQYLKNYLQEMQRPPLRFFDEMPSEIMEILGDQIIVTSLKNGYSKKATQTVLDEFLLSAQKNSLSIRS